MYVAINIGPDINHCSNRFSLQIFAPCRNEQIEWSQAPFQWEPTNKREWRPPAHSYKCDNVANRNPLGVPEHEYLFTTIEACMCCSFNWESNASRSGAISFPLRKNCRTTKKKNNLVGVAVQCPFTKRRRTIAYNEMGLTSFATIQSLSRFSESSDFCFFVDQKKRRNILIWIGTRRSSYPVWNVQRPMCELNHMTKQSFNARTNVLARALDHIPRSLISYIVFDFPICAPHRDRCSVYSCAVDEIEWFCFYYNFEVNKLMAHRRSHRHEPLSSSSENEKFENSVFCLSAAGAAAACIHVAALSIITKIVAKKKEFVSNKGINASASAVSKMSRSLRSPSNHIAF